MLFVITLLTLLGFTVARKCQNITILVNISARNGVFTISPPSNNIEATNVILNGVRQGSNATQQVLTGYATISGEFKIAATYCSPDKSTSKTIQLLTHGIGFDRSYWDVPFNNYNYSYIETAVDQYGYSTLSWDRLGIGMSDHPDPIADVQAPLEQAALQALTQMLQSGQVVGTKFQKVIHVGHSFGSELSYGLARDNPKLTSGLILTGFSQNATFLPYFQLGGNFITVQNSPLASKYAPGYLSSGDASAVQTNFFAPMNFDPNILAYAFANGQPVSIGELLTVGSEALGINPTTAPVLIITGERDLPFCGGDCLNTGNQALPNIPSSSKQYFPNTNTFETFIVPGSGHALNLEYSHETTYQHIQQFLARVGMNG